jgi:2-phosphosulfolactate phosphatase
MDKQQNLEVVFTPEMFQYFENPEANVVVVDILRATSAICTAFKNDVSKMIPVPSLEEARKYKEEGYIVAAERDGNVLDFADFGNSPFNFTRERVSGKEVAYSTTNGTRAIHKAKNSQMVIIGSFINLSAVADLLIEQKKDVIILCAGWKGKFCLEDTLFAGALAEILMNSNQFQTICDSTKASMDLWSMAKPDLLTYVDKVAQRERLRKLGLDDVIEYCHTPDSAEEIPFYRDGKIEAYKKKAKASE